MDNNKKCFLSS